MISQMWKSVGPVTAPGWSILGPQLSSCCGPDPHHPGLLLPARNLRGYRLGTEFCHLFLKHSLLLIHRFSRDQILCDKGIFLFKTDKDVFMLLQSTITFFHVLPWLVSSFAFPATTWTLVAPTVEVSTLSASSSTSSAPKPLLLPPP